jgi:iron complex transport system permease protein
LSPPHTPRAARRASGLAIAGLVLVISVAASIALGAKTLSPGEVWHGLIDPAADSYSVVHQMRLPRTELGLAAGLALGLAGALMQALTRNPLADPGVLGINAGAAGAVVTAISFAGVASFGGYVWFALAGAAVVSCGVYLVGGGRRATPVRLALAGAAINAALYSYVNAVQLWDTNNLDRMRFWTVGSIASAQPSTIAKVAPFIAAGVIAAFCLARPLNALALGDDAARALGSRPGIVRVAVIAAVTLLCGAATAACGPLVFVGLAVPHLVRAITGPGLGWLLPYCAVLAPVLVLGADILGRLVARPGEIELGVVTAIVGGPFFLYFVKRGRMATA